MGELLSDNFTTRSALLEDAGAVADLFNACAVEQLGRPIWEVRKIRREWGAPYVDLNRDTHLVFTPGGQLVGCALVTDAVPHVHIQAWVRVHPEYRQLGIGSYLATWAESRARQSVVLAPGGARVVLRQQVLDVDSAGQSLLNKRNYQQARYFLRMLIEMDAPPPLPVLPDSIILRPFNPELDAYTFVEAAREGFRAHWGHVEVPFEEEYRRWLSWMADDTYDPELWVVAVPATRAAGESAETEIVGFSVARERVVYDDMMGHVSMLTVRPNWRRQGIALALLQHSFGVFYQRGLCRVQLTVDADSLTGATRLYEKAGMRVNYRYVLYEKELRPGKELGTY